MSRVVIGSWSAPVIAPGAEALDLAGGIELDTRAGTTTVTCRQCSDWEAGDPAAMRAWANEHATEAHQARRPCVLALDPSLTSAGIALLARHPANIGGGTWPELTAHIGRPGHDGATYLERNNRIVQQVRGITRIVDDCRRNGADIRLAVIEGPIYGMTGGHAFDRAAVWWSLHAMLTNRRIPVAVVTPSHREKFITGVTGHKQATRERKARVVDEMRALWSFPNGTEITRDPLRKIVNDDEADALGMATMGAMALNWPVPFRPRRRHVENVALVQWPEAA